jgi:ubiquinone/menaquinone biosynthesis C-methylase UbiE
VARDTRSGQGEEGERSRAGSHALRSRALPAHPLFKQIAFFEKIWFGGGREWIGARAHGRVLEVAVGTGRNLAHYASQAAVTGVDLSPEMLALAKEYAAELGREADLREGDAAHLPFPDASFDSVVCALSLCSIPDPERAIAEMRRVLVTGGQLLLLDHIGSTWPPLYGAQWLVEQLTRPLAGEYQTRRQLPLVQAAGFIVEESERLKAGTIERLRATKPTGE